MYSQVNFVVCPIWQPLFFLNAKYGLLIRTLNLQTTTNLLLFNFFIMTMTWFFLYFWRFWFRIFLIFQEARSGFSDGASSSASEILSPLFVSGNLASSSSASGGHSSSATRWQTTSVSTVSGCLRSDAI